MERLIVLGNTGSGKSTLARALAADWGLEHIDLDTIVFDPEQIGVQRDAATIVQALDEAMARHPAWVMEGSYGDWAAHLSAHAEGFIFLNPPVDTCLAHQRARPHEPHKYDDPKEQEARLAFLMDWTAQYPHRTDQFGEHAHRAAFDAFDGRKVELRVPAEARAAVHTAWT